MPKPSPTQLAGLRAINEMRGVKVWSGGGLNTVSPASNYDGLRDPPANRTIQALKRRGLVESYNHHVSVIGSTYIYYRVTAKGQAVLGIS